MREINDIGGELGFFFAFFGAFMFKNYKPNFANYSEFVLGKLMAESNRISKFSNCLA